MLTIYRNQLEKYQKKKEEIYTDIVVLAKLIQQSEKQSGKIQEYVDRIVQLNNNLHTYDLEIFHLKHKLKGVE